MARILLFKEGGKADRSLVPILSNLAKGDSTALAAQYPRRSFNQLIICTTLFIDCLSVWLPPSLPPAPAGESHASPPAPLSAIAASTETPRSAPLHHHLNLGIHPIRQRIHLLPVPHLRITN